MVSVGMSVRIPSVGVNKALDIEEWNSAQSSGIKIKILKSPDKDSIQIHGTEEYIQREKKRSPKCCVNVRQAKFA